MTLSFNTIIINHAPNIDTMTRTGCISVKPAYFCYKGANYASIILTKKFAYYAQNYAIAYNLPTPSYYST